MVAGIVTVPMVAINGVGRHLPIGVIVGRSSGFIHTVVIVDGDQRDAVMMIMTFAAERRAHQADQHRDHDRDVDEHPW